MSQVMIAPSKYVQAPNALLELASYCANLGKNALCLISDTGLERNRDELQASFYESEVKIQYEIFNGECSLKEINRITSRCKEAGIDIIIGVGGGKIHDTSKAVGFYANLPVVIVPTIASTDAPCSALSVIYTDEGIFDRYLFLKKNPDLVLVDSKVIAQAPARLLVSGMGDALATYFEARACEKSNAKSCANGTTTMAAQALAKLCYETLLNEGYKAKLAVESKCVTKSLEKVIEANTLLSGLGFESGGLAAAHAIHNGLTVLEETHQKYHGEKVAFGTLVQLVLENESLDQITEVLDFCKQVGLPMTLEQLGLKEVNKNQILEVAKAATLAGETIHNMPFEVSVEDVYAAILVADKLGKDHLEKGR